MNAEREPITRFSQDMDGSMETDEGGAWVRWDDVVDLITSPERLTEDRVFELIDKAMREFKFGRGSARTAVSMTRDDPYYVLSRVIETAVRAQFGAES